MEIVSVDQAMSMALWAIFAGAVVVGPLTNWVGGIAERRSAFVGWVAHFATYFVLSFAALVVLYSIYCR